MEKQGVSVTTLANAFGKQALSATANGPFVLIPPEEVTGLVPLEVFVAEPEVVGAICARAEAPKMTAGRSIEENMIKE